MILKSFIIKLTISSSSGTRESKSRTSLFGTECGLISLRVNLIIPHSKSNTRIGTKCNTTTPNTSNTTASQLNSGTAKLNVLEKLK